MQVMTDIDLDGRYTVDRWSPGIAFYLLGYVETPNEDTEWTGYLDVDISKVRAVMVGDDHVHIVDVDDLTPLDDLDYCHVCGQVGCQHDGLDR